MEDYSLDRRDRRYGLLKGHILKVFKHSCVFKIHVQQSTWKTLPSSRTHSSLLQTEVLHLDLERSRSAVPVSELEQIGVRWQMRTVSAKKQERTGLETWKSRKRIERSGLLLSIQFASPMGILLSSFLPPFKFHYINLMEGIISHHW